MKVEFKPENFNLLHKVIQVSTARYLLVPLYFARNMLTWSGRENLPPRGTPMLVVPNHLSSWDPPVTIIATDRPCAFVAKEELFDVKHFNKLIEYYNAISINREKPEKSTFKSVKQIFKAGWSVCMYIEGTRARTSGVLGPPHLGAAYLARSNKVPICPIGIVGTDKRFKKAHAKIGKLIQPGDDLEKTTWQVMESLSELTGFSLPQTRELEKM
ncbi:MAG TPA: lysophospholipid acyltransferase family protein [Chroococcales cyanobacterium]